MHCGIDFLPLIGIPVVREICHAVVVPSAAQHRFPSGVWVRAKVEAALSLPSGPQPFIYVASLSRRFAGVGKRTNFLDAGVGPDGAAKLYVHIPMPRLAGRYRVHSHDVGIPSYPLYAF